MTKVCTKCGIEKDVSEFYKDATRLSGYRSHCKVCIKQYVSEHKYEIRKYRSENKNKIRADILKAMIMIILS